MQEVYCWGFSWVPHVVKVAQAVKGQPPGGRVRVVTDQPDMVSEMYAFARITGNTVTEVSRRASPLIDMRQDTRGHWQAQRPSEQTTFIVIILTVMPSNR